MLLGLIQKIQLHSQLQHGGVIKMMHYATSLQLVISTGPRRLIENGLLAVPRLAQKICIGRVCKYS